MRIIAVIAALSSLVVGAAARAQALPREAMLPLSLAVRAAQAGIDKCAGQGYWVSAAVVDRQGVARAILRHDKAGPHTLDSSRKKAYTAASLRRPTRGFAAFIADKPAIQGLRFMNDDILILGGGLPIKAGGEVIGGIGVGGAPGGDKDEACAQAGLDAIAARLK